jgi:hypothetical protein
MKQQQQNQLLQQALQQIQQQAQQIAQLQEQILPLQQQVQQQQEQIEELEEDIQQLQQQEADSDDDDDDDDDDDEDYGDPLVMTYDDAMYSACREGDVETIVRVLDAGKSVNCMIAIFDMTPIMVALGKGRLNAAIELFGRGADLSRVCSFDSNALHYASQGGNVDSIKWVFANTSIDVNSTNNAGCTPVYFALTNDHLNAGKLLVEKGANLFIKNHYGNGAMDRPLGPQVLQHAKDLIWETVKPLLLLSKACSTSTKSSSLINVFSISGVVRDYIAPYIMRKDIIIRDPSIPRPPKQPDDVKMRVEAALAAASSSSNSSSSNSSGVKRAREE